MKPSMLPWPALLLCVAALVSGTSSFPLERKDKRVQFAAWDDVNVIAHGLLQLGQGLKEHVDKTKGQVRELSGRLRTLDTTVAELGRETQQLRQEGETLRAELQAQESTGRSLNASTALQTRAEELSGDQQHISDRIAALEEKVDGMLQGEGMEVANGNYTDARTIQWMLEEQTRRIDDLVDRIRQQQHKLDKQNVQIRTLQNQIQQRKERSSLRRKVDENAQNASTEQSDSPMDMASDCHQLYLGGETSSGVYTVRPSGSQPFQVFCEMTSEGGWTVIQSRKDGSVDFDQLWQEYRDGFGSLKGEFWLGLEKIHSMTKNGVYVLQVQLSDWKDNTQSIRYSFRLDDEDSYYALHLQEVTTGGLESALTTEASGLPFSTSDRDHDQKADTNCAKLLSGGWWFGNCGRSNLNGRYFLGQPPKQREERKQGVFWKTWRGRYYPLKSTVMKIAPGEIQHSS
ncbi:hypothetical protein JZ751_015495 [Albula glossodonta]|uniref:Fibrinogen C-terminal domain-containing protein n=1 Tax=Albula glossodonta TaxID=121402 RepID=A0A8T2MW70_9TELE|nr:hypothetical protein JZ751_015495 [Albula glossodonta]